MLSSTQAHCVLGFPCNLQGLTHIQHEYTTEMNRDGHAAIPTRAVGLRWKSTLAANAYGASGAPTVTPRASDSFDTSSRSPWSRTRSKGLPGPSCRVSKTFLRLAFTSSSPPTTASMHRREQGARLKVAPQRHSSIHRCTPLSMTTWIAVSPHRNILLIFLCRNAGVGNMFQTVCNRATRNG